MPEFYKTGTISVTNGSVDFVGAGTTWLPANIKPGDVVNVAGQVMVIEEITDAEHGKFAVPYAGATASGLVYSAVKTSAAWGTNREIAVNTAELVQLLTTGQLFEWVMALTHEQGIIGEQTGVLQLRIPKDIVVQGLNLSLNQASASGNVSLDLRIDGVSILSTKLSVDQDETDSDSATTPYVLTQPNWNKGQILRVDFLTAGSNAAGAKLTVTGQRRN